MYDVIIIGGGPAGITAAIYAARKQMKFAIIYKEIGGEVAKTTYIENYTGYKNVSGAALTTLFEEHMNAFKPEIIEDEVREIIHNQKFFIIKTYERTLETKTILIATGATPKELKIPGEKEYMGKGVSWCSICDGPLFANKTVAVIGAGNTGLTTVLLMNDIAKKVYLISKYLEPKADAVMVEKAKQNPKLEIVREAFTQSINGTKFVESITVKQKDGTERTIPVDGVFINIGYNPNTICLHGMVELTASGDIKIDRSNMTSVPGIFAAGDVTDIPYKQIVIAAGEGANALLSIYDYLAKL
ncbi:MAG: FAD-dependent oxidoreductase [Candidatus Woesearchaeota archaeon]